MGNEYTIEFAEPKGSRCACCGGLTVTLTRFVYRNGDAFGVYYARYSASGDHADDEIAMLVSLGPWGEGTVPADRAAFSCRVRPTEDSYGVMLADAAESPWADAEVVGEKLSREAALAHPWKATAFEVVDEAFEQDRSLSGFLHRVQCGDASVAMEHSYQTPDVIFALEEEERGRAETRRHFAVLDGERHFVRCLFPVPVEGYDAWCVGLWIEVAKADYDAVVAAWDEPETYTTLRFVGRVSNDVRAALGLAVSLGDEVMVHVPDADAPPFVESSPVERVAHVLTTPWAKAAFEDFAVARGFL